MSDPACVACSMQNTTNSNCVIWETNGKGDTSAPSFTTPVNAFLPRAPPTLPSPEHWLEHVLLSAAVRQQRSALGASCAACRRTAARS